MDGLLGPIPPLLPIFWGHPETDGKTTGCTTPDKIDIPSDDMLTLGDPSIPSESAPPSEQHSVDLHSGNNGASLSPQSSAAGDGNQLNPFACLAPELEEAYTLILQDTQHDDTKFLSGMYDRSGRQYFRSAPENHPESPPATALLRLESNDILPVSESVVREETSAPAISSFPIPELPIESIKVSSDQIPFPDPEPIEEPTLNPVLEPLAESDPKSAAEPLTDQNSTTKTAQIVVAPEELEIQAENLPREATILKKLTIPPASRQPGWPERTETISAGPDPSLPGMKLFAEESARRILSQNSTASNLLSGDAAYTERGHELPFSLYLFGADNPLRRKRPEEEDDDSNHDVEEKSVRSLLSNFLRLSEAVKLATLAHSHINGTENVFMEGSPWFKVYFDYALQNSMLLKGEFQNINDYATRAEAAYLFANALPERMLSGRNVLPLPLDVPEQDPYSRHIQRLLNAHFLIGVDERGYFHPNRPITRTETAVILNRIILSTRNLQNPQMDISD
ncbi:MAG: S-layer homology domain-containing protein [Kiritimatiellales bacterium]